MFVISTRNFPPDIGGMQNLMGGLALSLLKHGPVKVFADDTNLESDFDKIDINKTKGIIISINSPGGSVSASYRLYEFFANYKKENGLPIYIHTNVFRWVFSL